MTEKFEKELEEYESFEGSLKVFCMSLFGMVGLWVGVMGLVVFPKESTPFYLALFGFWGLCRSVYFTGKRDVLEI